MIKVYERAQRLQLFYVSTDLQSVVKKCPNLFVPGDLQSPVIGSGSFVIVGLQIPRFHRSNLFFYGGFQIRRDGALLTVKKNLRHLRNLRDFKKQQGCSDDFSVRNRL